MIPLTMKNFTLLFLVAAMVLCTSGISFAQATFTDDFSVAKDYLTDNFDGTIWDGYFIDKNNETESDTLKVFDTKTSQTVYGS